jgi:hypothetical protein
VNRTRGTSREMGDTSLVAAQRRIAAGLIDDSRAFRSGLRVRGYISLYTSPFTKRGLLCDTTVLACSIAAVVFFMIETYQKGDSPVALDWVCVSSCVCVCVCVCGVWVCVAAVVVFHVCPCSCVPHRYWWLSPGGVSYEPVHVISGVCLSSVHCACVSPSWASGFMLTPLCVCVCVHSEHAC